MNLTAHAIAQSILDNTSHTARVWQPNGKTWARVYVKAEGNKDAGYCYVSQKGDVEEHWQRRAPELRQLVSAVQKSLPAADDAAPQTIQSECLECGAINPRWVESGGMGCSVCG